MSFLAMGPLLGPVIGPVAGGYLSQAGGWSWVFWLLAIMSETLAPPAQGDGQPAAALAAG